MFLRSFLVPYFTMSPLSYAWKAARLQIGRLKARACPMPVLDTPPASKQYTACRHDVCPGMQSDLIALAWHWGGVAGGRAVLTQARCFFYPLWAAGPLSA